MSRDVSITVRLSASELARLDELRPSGTPRATFMRSLLREPPNWEQVATRTEALTILTRLARDGRVTAAIALARELRDRSGLRNEPPDYDDGELDGSWRRAAGGRLSRERPAPDRDPHRSA
jgi:hypothetical protein